MADAGPPGTLITRLRRLGRIVALLSLGFGGVFVVLARRSAAAGESGEIAAGLFWVAAALQFALAFALLLPRLLGRGRRG